MTSEQQHPESKAANDEPTEEVLEEPSTEKEPEEEPKGGTTDAEPDHEAVGIGVIDSTETAQ